MQVVFLQINILRTSEINATDDSFRSIYSVQMSSEIVSNLLIAYHKTICKVSLVVRKFYVFCWS